MTPEECQRRWELNGDHPESWIQTDATYRMIWQRALKFAYEDAAKQITYYRDMWLAQRVENENYRKQLGLVAVSDEAERALTPRSTTPAADHSKE
jgi:hypothetical protein